jgi:aryl-alcohol dehydrogenase-like predicted oxidoreductase
MVTLGTTGLAVSRVGLGLAGLGRPAYINLGRALDYGGDRSVPAMERRCHDVLDAAFDAGVRYVDAARGYGLAEQFLASWIERRHLSPDVVTVGSKWGYSYAADWRLDALVHEVKDLSVQTLRRQFSESRAALGEWLRLYQIHSATLESGVLEDANVIEALVQLRSQGLAIGLSVTGPRQADTIRRALEVKAGGVQLFQVVQATWNLMEPSAGAALAEANARGVGVIVKEAVANGRLTARNASPALEPLRQIVAERHATIDAVAIAAALSQPWAHVVLSGAVTTEQLASNLRALDVDAIDLPALAQDPNEYWTVRHALRWN